GGSRAGGVSQENSDPARRLRSNRSCRCIAGRRSRRGNCGSGHSWSAVARDGTSEERQLDLADRAISKGGSGKSAEEGNQARERRQLLRALRGGRRGGAGRAGRV